MVIAMMVVFVVVLLSIVILDLSIHNTSQAAYDRKRVTSIAAAEGGIDSAWNLVQYTRPESLPWGAPVNGSVASAPGTATYQVEYEYFDANGTALTAAPSQTNVPAAVLVTSTGTTNAGVPRTMQTYMTLAPTYGGFGAAILSVTNTSFSNNFTIAGNNGNDGDVYVTNGNLTITNSPQVYGNIYVPNGSASVSNNSNVFGTLWANGSVTINNPSSVSGNVTSSTSSLSGSGAIGGSARAGTTIAAGLSVSGTRYPNSPQGPPPTQAFPLACQVAIAGTCGALPWPGYTVNTFTGASACTSAKTFLTTGTLSGDQLIWINQVCNLSMDKTTVNFTGNLAIVTQGSISMANNNNWNGVTGKNLFFIVNYRTGLNCASGSYNVSTANNSSFNNASVFFYSPCTVNINNQNDFNGQVIGTMVAINNHFTLHYVPVLVPGLGTVTGFNESIVYLREIKA
jgi:cytoskeletal protein CcmA (bactofilin family)